MPRALVGYGTWLNTATVLVGSLLGLWIGDQLPSIYKQTVLFGMGLVTIGIGVKLFFQSKSVPLVAASIAIGGIAGTLLGLHGGIESFGEWARTRFGSGSPTFVEGVVTASVLFCVGPMTLLGCLQESMEKRIDLLSIKSTLDGFSALFLSATLGPGVIVSAAVVFVVQGLLTILGRRMERVAKSPALVDEMSAAGGPMLLAIGFGLLELKSIPVANYLPALLIAPLFAWVGERFRARQETLSEAE